MLNNKNVTMDEENIKLLVELSETVQEADSYIKEYSGLTETPEKLEFLLELIPCTILSRDTHDEQDISTIIEDDYYCILHHIIKRKWRTSVSVSR